ncbi:hypothetical protein HPB48_022009 [Haemaphysalis longicornis]|uniref:protein-tyrosine-phosphatase n=1 Tax=Haemaphysalis longicornis TaxID=44386 RepID=A0A9J6FTH7_HAELO|nr:hypothetical protein HPB48_022009 [Haemaphysalis longicornis]
MSTAVGAAHHTTCQTKETKVRVVCLVEAGRKASKWPVQAACRLTHAGSLSIVDENDGLDFEMEEVSGSRNGASSKPLPLSELQNYVQRMLACDGLKSEFIDRWPPPRAERFRSCQRFLGNLRAAREPSNSIAAASANYGEVQVHFIAEEKFPDYTVNQLHITLADTTREVKHFHLQSWPDHGVPLYPNKVNQYRTFNEAPVVVHCSAGIGRTGAYILLDNVLEQADAEGVVDVVGQLAAMRQNRMNVVETLGFQKKDKFLVTQTPSSKDVDDLWKMVIESGTRTIVTLDVFGEGSEVVPFWPKEGSLRYGDHRVECLESQNVNDMSVQVFKVTSKHKLKYEQEVDVFYATKIVRENRPQFIVDSVSLVLFILFPTEERHVLTEDGALRFSFAEKSGLP